MNYRMRRDLRGDKLHNSKPGASLPTYLPTKKPVCRYISRLPMDHPVSGGLKSQVSSLKGVGHACIFSLQAIGTGSFTDGGFLPQLGNSSFLCLLSC